MVKIMITKFTKLVVTMMVLTCWYEALWPEPCPVRWLALAVSARCVQLQEDLVAVSMVIGDWRSR